MKRLFTLLALLSGLSLSAQEYLGGDHALYKVTASGRYLILPVEDAAPDALVHILSDNYFVEKIYVRLAREKVDYCVPLDLSRYQGHISLDVMVEGVNSIRWQDIASSESFSPDPDEAFRPSYHFTPAYGWMNDPNGMVYKDGEYHLFYQYNPYGSRWGNMHWGHAVSRDMIRWEHRPVALRPTALGDVFSGSCVASGDTIAAIYTSAGKHQMQSLAYSTDGGLSFSPYPLNPVISSTTECRDPKVFRHPVTGLWTLVLASPLEHQVRFYTSENLRDWTYRSSFGTGWGRQDGIWECPDLFERPTPDGSRWVLIVNLNPGGLYGNSATQYFVGQFDGYEFVCESSPEKVKWLDYGPDHYAAVTWSGQPGSRHTLLAWMSNWRYADVVPSRPFRSADSLPRDLALYQEDGEHYLAVTPVEEVKALRGKAAYKGGFRVGAKAKKILLPESCQGHCEILFDANSSRGPLQCVLSNGKEELLMTVDFKDRTFRMDRSRSGDCSFSPDFASSVFQGPLHNESFRIFVDASSVEVFTADGKMAMTALIFPSSPYDRLCFRSETGGTNIKNLIVYPLK